MALSPQAIVGGAESPAVAESDRSRARGRQPVTRDCARAVRVLEARWPSFQLVGRPLDHAAGSPASSAGVFTCVRAALATERVLCQWAALPSVPNGGVVAEDETQDAHLS